jgi:hypothetical protein
VKKRVLVAFVVAASSLLACVRTANVLGPAKDEGSDGEMHRAGETVTDASTPALEPVVDGGPE